MLAPKRRHTAHWRSISARSSWSSGYGMFFWKPKAGATKWIFIPSASQSASMIAVVAAESGYELPVNVDVLDPAGDKVFHAEIRMWLSPKR